MEPLTNCTGCGVLILHSELADWTCSCGTSLPDGPVKLLENGSVHYPPPWASSKIQSRHRGSEPGAQSDEAARRKGIPVASGFCDYFPDAIRAIAELSRIGNDQHNPGKLLHWDRSKSGDEADALMRHFLERGTADADGVRHTTKVAWRALALLQKEIEEDQ